MGIPFSSILKGGSTFQAFAAKPDDICTLQYTGGTTGASKGVMLTNKSILSNIAQALTVLSNLEKPLHGANVIAPGDPRVDWCVGLFAAQSGWRRVRL